MATLLSVMRIVWVNKFSNEVEEEVEEEEEITAFALILFNAISVVCLRLLLLLASKLFQI